MDASTPLSPLARHSCRGRAGCARACSCSEREHARTRGLPRSRRHADHRSMRLPVLGHIEGGEIDTTFFNKTANPVKQIGVFPGQTLTLTNLDSRKTITVVNAGSTQFRAERDGSVELAIMGHGPLPNEVAGGQPGIWYLSGGRVFVTLDADGNPTSITVKGNVVNLCDQLAPAS